MGGGPPSSSSNNSSFSTSKYNQNKQKKKIKRERERETKLLSCALVLCLLSNAPRKDGNIWELQRIIVHLISLKL